MTAPLLALVLVTLVLAATLVPLLRDERTLAPAGPESDLAERRQELVESLRDLEFDYEAGKVTAEDRDRMRAELEGKAVRVLAALDAASGDAPDAGKA